MIFSYFMLCEFSFYETDMEKQNDNNSTTIIIDIRSEKEENKNQIIKPPSRTAYLLTFWIISFIMEEIRQVDNKITLFYTKKFFLKQINYVFKVCFR